jgi:hypothetical protein
LIKDVSRRGYIKTIGLRISEDTYELVHKVSKKNLKELESKFGLDLTEGSTLMRLAISNLLQNPPTDENVQNLIISCKDDKAFAVFLKNIVGEIVAK